jgi:hypothetical protein
MDVLMDREKWSESSKRSFAYYGSSMTCYENISYRCTKCSQPSVFTAEEQKIAYEIRKEYIWKIKTLCSVCHSNLELLRKKDKQFQEEWAKNKGALKVDYKFLCAWLEILEDVPSYGKKAHFSMINMLTRLAHECV